MADTRNAVGSMIGIMIASCGVLIFLLVELPCWIEWIRTRSWSETQAFIETVDFKGFDTHWIDCHYRYEVGGKEYNGTRVGLASSRVRSSSSLHKKRFKTLKSFCVSHTPAPLWYNPKKPEEAMLFRDITWEMIYMPLLLGIFTSIGIIFAKLGRVGKIDSIESTPS